MGPEIDEASMMRGRDGEGFAEVKCCIPRILLDAENGYFPMSLYSV